MKNVLVFNHKLRCFMKATEKAYPMSPGEIEARLASTGEALIALSRSSEQRFLKIGDH